MVRHGTSMISQKATDWATSDAAKCIVAGAVTFAGSLSLSTAIQYQTRLISTGTPVPIPTLAGMASVAASSWACHQAALFTNHCLQLEQHRKSNNLPNLPLVDRATDYWTTWNQRRREALRQSDPLDVLQLGNFRIPWHTIRVYDQLRYKVLLPYTRFTGVPLACWRFEPWVADSARSLRAATHTWGPLRDGVYQPPKATRQQSND